MPAGRPFIFKTEEELQAAIDEYFAYCDNHIKEIHPKEGEAYGIADPIPYAMAGLAYALGVDRKTILNYEGRDKYSSLIKRARNRVEADIERRMLHKDTFTPGLIFNAKNNFDWKDKSEQDITTGGDKLQNTSADKAIIDALIEQVKKNIDEQPGAN